MVNVIIDGIKVSAPDNATILQAAELAGVKVPTLCYHPDQAIKANCRVCVCEVEGLALLQAACSTPIRDGMVIRTNTPAVIEARRTILQLI
ncbi:MAG: 2Fe-2S iron-sulfur cluster binding domain-containing protein, partial [Clostridia bacterium]|nr:2Fe-2S iron-sulfur cluster binding domain-containing protein [Clostridia bacterium]